MADDQGWITQEERDELKANSIEGGEGGTAFI
jgi:hypothetical protein